MNPLKIQSLIIGVALLDEFLIRKMRLAKTKDNIVYNIEGNFEVILLLPMQKKKINDFLDVLPMFQYIGRMILEDRLDEIGIPL